MKLKGSCQSVINADGIPFQWSVSTGSGLGGGRFLTDCGSPALSIGDRVACTKSKFSTSQIFSGTYKTPNTLERVLECLLPPGDLLNASPMGFWLSAGENSCGVAKITIYLNNQVGDIISRYRRFGNCLAMVGRLDALDDLRDIVGIIDSRAVPIASAVEIDSVAIGRLKLYFRASVCSKTFFASVAIAAGKSNELEPLSLFHRAFLEDESYPPESAVFSLEFGSTGPPSFKLDLNTGMFLPSDVDVDRRILLLHDMLGIPDYEYVAVRDIVAPRPSATSVSQILFCGLAMRHDDRKVNVYFHPAFPTPTRFS